jgi:hypothetical protein
MTSHLPSPGCGPDTAVPVSGKKPEHSSKLEFKNCYSTARTFIPDSKSRLKPTSPNNQKEPTVIYGLFRRVRVPAVCTLCWPSLCIVLLIQHSIFAHKVFTAQPGILIPSALQRVPTTAPTVYGLVKIFGQIFQISIIKDVIPRSY